MTREVEHADIFGQPLELGCYVAASRNNAMYICRVVKLNPKMIRVLDVASIKGREWLVYSKETVKVSGSDVTAYILKYAL